MDCTRFEPMPDKRDYRKLARWRKCASPQALRSVSGPQQLTYLLEWSVILTMTLADTNASVVLCPLCPRVLLGNRTAPFCFGSFAPTGVPVECSSKAAALF